MNRSSRQAPRHPGCARTSSRHSPRTRRCRIARLSARDSCEYSAPLPSRSRNTIRRGAESAPTIANRIALPLPPARCPRTAIRARIGTRVGRRNGTSGRRLRHLSSNRVAACRGVASPLAEIVESGSTRSITRCQRTIPSRDAHHGADHPVDTRRKITIPVSACSGVADMVSWKTRLGHYWSVATRIHRHRRQPARTLRDA